MVKNQGDFIKSRRFSLCIREKQKEFFCISQLQKFIVRKYSFQQPNIYSLFWKTNKEKMSHNIDILIKTPTNLAAIAFMRKHIRPHCGTIFKNHIIALHTHTRSFFQVQFPSSNGRTWIYVVCYSLATHKISQVFL